MPMPTASGGSRSLPGLAEQLVEDDRDDADRGADADHLPVEVAAEHAGGERRDQRRLRRRQRVRPGAGRAGEAVGGVEQVEHRRDHDRAEDHAVDQRHLLPPRRRADQLAGLQVLEIVVGDGGDAEHDRGGEQGIGDQRGLLLRAAAAAEPEASSSEAERMARMPMPEIGLFEAPISPAM